MIFALSLGDFEISRGILSLGVFTGLTYGLLAAGLVLVFRSSRFVNFAHGAIGVFGAAVCSLAVRDFELPYWIAFALGVLVSAGVGAITEISVVKPLASAPKVLSMVATLGVATFLIFTALAINPTGLSGLNFPEPAGLPTGEIGALRITPAFSAQAILSPLVLGALGIFMWKSKLGMAIRAAASNGEAAFTAGIGARRMSVASWAIAGGLAAFSVCLIIPTKGVVTPETLGPELLIRGLAAAAIARFAHYGIAIGVATSIGVFEQILATNPEANGAIEVLILLMVMVALLTTSTSPRAVFEQWGQRSLPTKIPFAYRQLPVIRFVPKALGAVFLVGAFAVPFYATGSQALDATIVLSLAMVSLSLVIVTGLGGQLSLAQFAYGAISAAVAVRTSAEFGLLAGILSGACVAALVAAALAAPALRVQGLTLGVLSLTFSVVTTSWLLDRNFLLGGAGAPTRPDIDLFGLNTNEARGYYWIALVAMLFCLAIVYRLRHSAWARSVVAVRDNPNAARAMSLPDRSIKLQVAAVGGFIAGIGGAIYGHAFSNLSATNFGVQLSIDAITATVLGGLGSLFGPLIGAFYLAGIPAFFSPTADASSALAGIWIILIVHEHGGVSALLGRVWHRAMDMVAKSAGINPVQAREVAAIAEDEDPQIALRLRDAATKRKGSGATEPLISVAGVSKSYGGITAVSDVSLTVNEGEIVGLIGPNGAGKTTLFEIISGFVQPDQGTVSMAGIDITKMPPSLRARKGMARSFQSARLYPTLTLLETVMVARERVMPSSFGEAFGPQSKDATRTAAARSLIGQFGLTRFTDTPIGALPTGTRRLAELASAVALQPKVILLDEPSAGIAHAEREHLATVLADLRSELGITLLVIEHDLPMLADICDRMIALELGEVVASGTPSEVRSHHRVIVAYLGTGS